MRFYAIITVKIGYRTLLLLVWFLWGLSACVAVDERATATSQAVLGRSPLLTTQIVDGECTADGALILETWLSTAQSVRQNAMTWVNDALDNPLAPLGETYQRLLKAHDRLATTPIQTCVLEAQMQLLRYLQLGLSLVQNRANGAGDVSTLKVTFNALHENLITLEDDLGKMLEALTTND